MQNPRKTWTVVVVYALAMAWVEAAVVFYLRSMINRIEPYQPNPLPVSGGFAGAELIREVATMVMLLTVGILAGKTWRSRLGYSAIAFGVWDIGYYVFLRWMCGWPHSIMDWDILFLLPLPWWGPVLAPVSIAALMILWGTQVSQFGARPEAVRASLHAWVLNSVGILLALYVFMTDSLKVAAGGPDVLRDLLPETFNWPLFLVALVLMAAPILQIAWQLSPTVLSRTKASQSSTGSPSPVM